MIDDLGARWAAIKMRELDEDTRNRLIKEPGSKVFDLRPILRDMKESRRR